MPSAWRRHRSEWNNQQSAEHHLVPAEHNRCGLQWGRLQAEILCLQLSGEALWHTDMWRIKIYTETEIWCGIYGTNLDSSSVL